MEEQYFFLNWSNFNKTQRNLQQEIQAFFYLFQNLSVISSIINYKIISLKTKD